MSRAPAVPDPSRETFAGMLQHFAQPASRSEMRGEDESVRVSISGRGAAALAEERKRTLTPVKILRTSGNGAASEATEISYEKALRLLNRHRAPSGSGQDAAEQEARKRELPAKSTPEPQRAEATTAPAARPVAAPPTGKGEIARARSMQSSRVEDAARPRSAAHPSPSESVREPVSRPARTDVRPAPEFPPAAATRDNAAAGASTPSARKKGEPPAKAAASLNRAVSRPERDGAASAGRHPSRHGEHSPAAVAGKRMAGKHVAGGKNAAGLSQTARPSGARKRQSPRTPPAARPGIERQKASPVVEPAEAIAPASLEIARHDPAPEQRNAIVSIRVNDMEFERLRLRAAESGLSVSAYMRSCVLEAEHLRAQVKQALAEMRSSIHLAQTAQPVAPITVLAREHHTTAGGSWTRFLWRSATFVLGPLLAFRHRS